MIEGVDPSNRHILRHYWAQNPNADLTDIALQVESLLFIPKGAHITLTANQNTLNQTKI